MRNRRPIWGPRLITSVRYRAASNLVTRLWLYVGVAATFACSVSPADSLADHSETIASRDLSPSAQGSSCDRAFSGFAWKVPPPDSPNMKDSQWSCDTSLSKIVTVGAQQQLQLSVALRNGKWYAPELQLTTASGNALLGFGDYAIDVQSGLGTLPDGAVFSLYSYEPSPVGGTNEIDIEVSRWGNPNLTQILQYVVWPDDPISPTPPPIYWGGPCLPSPNCKPSNISPSRFAGPTRLGFRYQAGSVLAQSFYKSGSNYIGFAPSVWPSANATFHWPSRPMLPIVNLWVTDQSKMSVSQATVVVTAIRLPVPIFSESGNLQTGMVSTTLPQPIVVSVRDAANAPMAGVSVAFTPGALSGAVSPSLVTTDNQGLARTSWTLGAQVGTQILSSRVQYGTLSAVNFTATAVAGFGSVGGTVSSTMGAPLGAVTVNVTGAGSTQTNTLGAYDLASVPSGTQTLTLSSLPAGCTNPGAQAVLVAPNTSTVVNLTVVCSIPAVGLLAHYSLDGNGTDASGNGFDAILVGGAAATDRHGNAARALLLNGGTDQVNIPAVVTDARPSGSIVMWLKLTDTQSQYSIFAKVGPTGNPPQMRAQFAGPTGTPILDRFYFTINGGDATNSSVPVAAYGFTNWHMYTFSWSPTGRSIYLDDQLLIQLPSEAASSPVGSSLMVGCCSKPIEQLKGIIDEMMIFDRQLTLADVRSLYVP